MLMATQSPATIVGVISLLLLLDFIVVVLRYRARKARQQLLMADDWLCFVSLILAVGLATTLYIGVAQNALAYPTPMSTLRSRTDITESNDKIIVTARLQYIFLVLSVPTLGAIKLSVLFFYRRIFVIEKGNPRDVRNIAYIGMMTVVALWTAGFCLSFMFACKGHFSAWWMSASSLISNCVNTLELLFAYAVSDFITDVVVIAIPIPSVMSLHLSTSRKLGVVLVFLLGALSTVASMIRMIWVIWARQVGFDPSLDEDLLITTLLFWSMLEVTFGIIASCLPTLRAMFQIKSIDSVLRSVRSKTSLGSRKAVSNKDVPLDYLTGGASKTSHEIPLVPNEHCRSTTVVAGSGEPHYDNNLGRSTIRIETDYTVQSDITREEVSKDSSHNSNDHNL